VVHHVEVGVGLVDTGVDDVSVDVRDPAPPIAGPRAADVGVDTVDALGQCLGGDAHRAVALDVVYPLLGEHLVQSVVGDASGVALQGVSVGVEHLRAVALSVLPCDRGRIPDLLIEHDYVLAREGALRGSPPGRKRAVTVVIVVLGDGGGREEP
jgi:hypothetical protein